MSEKPHHSRIKNWRKGPCDTGSGASRVQELTSAIREMASRLDAQFVLDDRKTQNYIAASEEWAVVDGKPTETIVAFGQFDELRNLIEDVDAGL